MSREEAIKMLNDIGKYLCSGNPVWDTNKVAEAIRTAIVDMRMMPKYLEAFKAQPRKGKWIDHSNEGYVECPFCHSATNCDGNKDELHYCFSCGADMRGGRNERQP